jgi:hypothetical protein
MAPRTADDIHRRVPPHHQLAVGRAASLAGNRHLPGPPQFPPTPVGEDGDVNVSNNPPYTRLLDVALPLTNQRLEELLLYQQRAGAVGNVTAATGNPLELGRLFVEEQTTKFMYASYVKDKLFPQSKFLELDSGDMEFSHDPHSACQFMARELNLPVPELPVWWAAQRKGIHATFMHHRNNVIKAIRTTFMRKSYMKCYAGVRLLASAFNADAPNTSCCFCLSAVTT